MAIDPTTGYPDWVNVWAQHYGIDPGTLWSNVQLGNSQAVDPQQYPGSDINAQTGRRWIDSWQDPSGTPQSDLASVGTWQQAPESMQHGPNNFMERLASYSPYIIGGMAAGGAGLALAGGGAAAGTGTLAASSVPAASVSGTELGMLGGGAAGAGGGIGTLSASSLPAAAGVTGTELGMYGSGAAGLGGLGAGGMGPSAEYAGVAPGTTPYGPPGAYAGSGGGSVPGASSWQDYIKQLSGVSSAMGGTGGGSGNGGSLLGGLLGAGLGYLDAASQPNSMTVTNMPDPYSLAAAYGPNGTLSAMQNAYATSQGQPNYLGQAGQQISAMGQQAPTSWADLVGQNKGMWDSNPWVQQQQQANTAMANQNLMQNVMPGIGSAANAAGGYGGSRQGIAQGVAMANMQAPLSQINSNLAANAYESAQGRAMQGAQYAGQYGLAGQQQQAGLLGAGANMQMQAPWYNANQYAQSANMLPRGGSTTTPLFNNPIAGALGGAQAGSNWAGNVDWGQLLGTVGGWFK